MLITIAKDKTLLVILAAALALRLAVFLTLNIDNFDFGDAPHYIQMAQNLASGKGFTLFKEGIIARDYEGEFAALKKLMTPEQLAILESHYYIIVPYGQPFIFWDPLLPLFMLLFVALGDGGLLFFNLAGCVMGTLLVWLIYRLGEQVFNQRAGLFAAAIMALEPNSVFYSSVVLTENLAVFLLLISFLMMCRCQAKTSWHYFFTLGIGLSLLYLSRANLLILLPIGVIYLYFRLERGIRWKAALLILGFIAAAAPWWARNKVETGSFGFMPTKGVFNLWKSTADAVTLANEMGYDVRRNPRGSFAQVEKMVNYPQAMYFTCVEGKTEIQRAASLRRQTVKFIFANPELTVKRYFRHLLDFFNPVPYFGSRLLKIYLAATYIIILLLGGLGITAAIKNGKGVHPLLAYALIFILIAGWFRLGFRFRIPLMPVFMLMGGYYLSLIFKPGQKSKVK